MQDKRLLPDHKVCGRYSISPMTLWRWDRDPELTALGWPAPVYIRKRKYRGRKKFEKFKALLIRRAIKTRNEKVA